MATMWHIIQLVTKLKVEAEPGLTHPPHPHCWVATRLRIYSHQGAGRELVDGDDGGAAWLRCCRISHYLRSVGNAGDAHPTLIGGC